MRSVLIVGLTLLATAAAAQAPAPAADPADWRAPGADDTLVIDTTKGRYVVEMSPEIAPVHVARMKAMARQRYYDGSLFYRSSRASWPRPATRATSSTGPASLS